MHQDTRGFSPSIRQRLFRRRCDRRLFAQGALLAVAVSLLWSIPGKVDQAFGLDQDAPAEFTLAIHDTRTCATVAVYLTATADDWGQRAVIARTQLNKFAADGVPDCAPNLLRILDVGLDHLRWQAALDAVDAVSSGSYALPVACERVDSVAPLDEATGSSPIPGDLSARSQCVINGLAFWESRA